MKHYIFFALMFFSLHLGAQCVIPITEVSKTIYVPIDEIAYVISSGTGASIVRQAGLRQLNTVEDVDSIVSLCSPSLLKFTDGSNGKVMAVSKTFIDRIVINGNGKAVIQTKNARIAYISFEDAEDLNVDILNCYGESKGEVESPGNCIKTITQSAHGFSEGDVLFWDTDKYVNLEGNYTGAEVPLYVVTDSLTTNTFTAASCGEIDSDFGLADGLYYATNTGLELAPEEIEYPAVVVYGSKSKIVLNYGLEFDATGKPLFDIVTVTGQRTIEGGDTMDLHADSIRVSITIADTAATDVGHALELLRNNSGTPGAITGSGTAGNIPVFTGTSAIGNSVITATSTDALVTRDAIGTSLGTRGFTLQNSTPAISGTNQNSPALYLSGRGWNGGSSKEAYVRMFNVPYGTASNPMADFYLQGLTGVGANITLLRVRGESLTDAIAHLGTSTFNGNSGIAIGGGNTVSSGVSQGFVIGTEQIVSASNASAWGRYNSATHSSSFVFGEKLQSDASDTYLFGLGFSLAQRSRNQAGFGFTFGTYRPVYRIFGFGAAVANAWSASSTTITLTTPLTLRVGQGIYLGQTASASFSFLTVTAVNSATEFVVDAAPSVSSGTHVQVSTGSLFEIGNGASYNNLFQVRGNGRIRVGYSAIIGDTSSDANTSSILELKSTTQGFLPTRMTGAQAEAIASPAEGLMIYATDGSGVTITTKGWWGFDGSTWLKLN